MISLIVHGGAWDIPDPLVDAHRAGCAAALKIGWDLLARGGSAIDAVEQVIRSPGLVDPRTAVKLGKIVRFRENRFANGAGREAALGGFLDDENDLAHAGMIADRSTFGLVTS